ncbi:unnamed protein product [Miscanthus lutarioriparius]|uniref:Uncharacterized protein n=1 Tax=Miscanthus lutarioriparius TaxID=422564 RepID=A0A811NED9_9POAL|nr:unnamed protein product [Miscanthus lutarioriparius]
MDGAKVVAVAAGSVFVKTTWLPFRFSLAMTDGADAKVHLHCEQWDQTIAEHLVLAERYLAFHQPDAMYSFHDVGKGQVADMGSGCRLLKRKRVYADPPPAITDTHIYRWVEFHEVGMEHISSIWDVSVMVFWKGNVRHHHGDTYLRVILKDEQTIVIYLLDLIFLQGTKMEAVAYGDQTMRFDRLLRVGECYDFMRVGFAPTHVGPLSYIFRLCADYFVVLSP